MQFLHQTFKVGSTWSHYTLKIKEEFHLSLQLDHTKKIVTRITLHAWMKQIDTQDYIISYIVGALSITKYNMWIKNIWSKVLEKKKWLLEIPSDKLTCLETIPSSFYIVDVT